jgi:hypothetical protein
MNYSAARGRKTFTWIANFESAIETEGFTPQAAGKQTRGGRNE